MAKKTSSEFNFMAKVWVYNGQGAWHFVSLPEEISEQIYQDFEYLKRGWGSIEVEVKLGESSWFTSIFRDKKTNSYILPIKAAIRKQENILEGAEAAINLKIRFALGG